MNTTIKRTFSELIFDYGNILFMLALITAALYPLLYILFASFSDLTLLAQHRGLLAGRVGVSTEAYARVFENPSILTGYRNTIFYVGSGTFISIILTTLGAFVLSRRDVLWKEPIMFLIVFTMFFSGGLIPSFLLVSRTLGWFNSPFPLLLPDAIQPLKFIFILT